MHLCTHERARTHTHTPHTPQLKETHEFFKDHILGEAKSYYQCNDTPGVLPHVWLDAKQVWFSLSLRTIVLQFQKISV